MALAEIFDVGVLNIFYGTAVYFTLGEMASVNEIGEPLTAEGVDFIVVIPFGGVEIQLESPWSSL